MNNPTPRCCGSDARWVNNGPALQYFFCDECKQEVSSAVPAEELQGLEQKPSPFFQNKSVGKWISLDAQMKHAAEYAKQIQADAFSKAFGFPPKWQGPPVAKRTDPCADYHVMNGLTDKCTRCGGTGAELLR